MKSFLCAALMITACAACGGDRGDDGEGGTCDGEGSGVVTGSVAGTSVGTVVGASAGTEGAEFLVVISDGGDACDGSAAGDELVLSLCGTPAAQTYAIGSDGCPGAEASARLVNALGSDAGSPTGGSVVITSAADTCVAGTFSLEFGSDSLTGSFAAVVCTLQL